MKTKLIIILIISIVCLPLAGAFAQDVSSPENGLKNSLHEDFWALQFQIGDNFSLRAFQGLGLSAKKHMSNKSAIRVGVGLSITSRDDENFARVLPLDSVRQSQGHTMNHQSVDFSVQHLLYPKPDADVNVFYGGGPLVRFRKNKSESSQSFMSGGAYVKSNAVINERAWAVGISGLLGVEWFASKSISFLGEYSISCEYYSARTTRSETTTQSTSSLEYEYGTDTFQIYPLAVRFGLSVYF